MPDNCCVPLCCKTGYRIDSDGRKVTLHNLPKDPKKLKVIILYVSSDLKIFIDSILPNVKFFDSLDPLGLVGENAKGYFARVHYY